MDTDALRDALEGAGLTEYQVAAYLTLLELGTAPVVTVAQRASVPTAQIYDTIRALEDRGFVETIERDQLHARARAPDGLLEELRAQSELFAAAADEIEDRWTEPDAQDYRVNVLKRRESVLNRAAEAIEGAAVSVELAGTVDQYAQLRDELRRAKERGVVTRATYAGRPDADLDPDGVIGLRCRPLPTPFLAVVDRRRAFFAPAEPHGEPYGMVINDDILTLVLHWFHLTLMWLPCERVATDPEAAPTYISVEGFIHDIAPLWSDGARIRVRIRGQDPETNEHLDVTGAVAEIAGGWQGGLGRRPSVIELSGLATLVVEAGDRQVTVGGWGAVYEDLEAQVIMIEGIEWPPLQS